MLDGAIAHEDVVSALDILLALARERYVSFKLFVFVDFPPDAIAVIEEFVYANVVHNDFFIVGGEVNSVLRATALDGAHLTIALTGNGAASIDLLTNLSASVLRSLSSALRGFPPRGGAPRRPRCGACRAQ